MLYPKCLARGQHFVNLAVIKGGGSELGSPEFGSG